MLETGTKAPAFELPDQNGVMHRLEDYKGKKVILYFYPKIILRDVRSRPAAIRSAIRNLWRRAR